ncbi:heme peroxidase [Thozetella sp. PMI_491]|nr:heme peroxidase [Thozetella sp. PMI_491]
MKVTLPPLLGVLSARGCLAALYYPSLQVSLLEHILVDNWGAYASNFSAAITPCTNYVTEVGDPAIKSGRTTAAQWIRVAFHDFVTANVTAGTGGLDASIGFETLRSENSGSAMNDSFTFWRPFVNDAVPMADLVALGTVMSSSLCGGYKIPFRPGRIDALHADPTTGVPAPETDLEETLVFFNRSGFGSTDAIGLTACGHTMGSVHHGGFPDVVPESAVNENNTNGGSNFDTSRGAFDTRVVHEYIDGTGNRGGPLVTTDNVTTRSDLRLYESDNNATMQALYDQGDGFLQTCVTLLGRMINTVPNQVVLQDPITALPVKPVNVSFGFGDDGKLELTGRIRVLTSSGSTAPPSLTIALSNGLSTLASPEPETGTSVFGGDASLTPPVYGTTTYFPFRVCGPDLSKAISLAISGDGIQSVVFPLEAHEFIDPSLTQISGSVIDVTIAVLAAGSHSGAAPEVQVAAPIGQSGTLGPQILRNDVAVSKSANLKDGFEMWSGTLDLGHAVTGAVSVKALAGGVVVDTLMVSNGVAGW